MEILSFTTLRVLTDTEKDILSTKKCTGDEPANTSALGYMCKKKFYDMQMQN